MEIEKCCFGVVVIYHFFLNRMYYYQFKRKVDSSSHTIVNQSGSPALTHSPS
jgi:hypothetical protein